MINRIAILGSSGHGKVIADTALLLGWNEVIFFDDAWPDISLIGSWPVVGNTNDLVNRLENFESVIVGIGDCKVRWQKFQLLRESNARMPPIIHPKAYLSPRAKIGDGSVVFGGAVINVDADIGEACIINSGATVDHDCTISNAVHVAPGAHLSGNVVVGDRSWVGVGSAIKQGLIIGDDVMVGAGAVVTKHIPDSNTVVGNPAVQLGVS